MALCKNAELFERNVDYFIKKYEGEIKNDDTSEIYSDNLKDTLSNLYAHKEAINNEDLKFINALGKYELNAKENNKILEEAFKEEYGDYFTFTRGSSNALKVGTIKSIKAKSDNIEITYSEKGKTYSNIFSPSSPSRSTNDSNNKFINIKNFDNFVGRHRILSNKRNKDKPYTLGSSNRKIKLSEEYKQSDYEHGDIKSMKDTLKRVHLLGKEKASSEELDSLLSLIDRMDTKFFNELELYLEEDGTNSGGVTRSKRIDLIVDGREKYVGNQQSEASIYMEEVIHSMTASAMHSDTLRAKALKTQLALLIERARKQITWKDFLPSEENSIDKSKEIEYAKWLYNYIFSGKNADFEFIAKALTVPEVSNALSKIKNKKTDVTTFLDKVIEFFETVVEILSGNITLKQYNETVHESLVNLAFSFGEINNKATRKLAEQDGYIDNALAVVNNLDDHIHLMSNKVKNALGKHGTALRTTDKPTTLYGRVMDVAKFITFSLTNPIYVKSIGLLASSYGIKPESTLREVIGGLFASDSVQKVADFLISQSGYIDKQRNAQINLVRKNVLSKFKKPNEVSKELEEALTAVLADTRLSSLFGNDSITKDIGIRKTVYTNKLLRKLLTDNEELDKLINNVKKALKDIDKENYYWHANQAVGLGIYMSTHKATKIQNFNSHNIARGIHSSKVKIPDIRIEKAVDELSTLVAIKNTSLEERALVASVMTTEWAGVQHVADIIEGFSVNTDETVFKGKKTNKIRGYTKEVFDDSISVEIAPLKDRKTMEAKGYVFKSKLNTKLGETRVNQMALYVTDTFTRDSRVRGAARLNTVTSKGTTITSTNYKDASGLSTEVTRDRSLLEIKRIETEANLEAKGMETSNFDFTDSVFGVAPIIDNYGNVTDYRYMMDKKTKKALLKQDTRISEVMAKSFGGLVDKVKTVEHNKKVLEALKEDMVNNWESGGLSVDSLTEYTLIGPDAANVEMRKLYYMLPKEFKNFINKRNDKTLAVRTDLLHVYFGYKDLSIANIPVLSSITPKVVLQAVRIAEKLWMEVVKIVKTNILVKMPTVMLGNIISNLVQAVLRGYNPFKVLNLYLHSYRNIKTYNKNSLRLQELDNSIRESNIAVNKNNISKQRKYKLKVLLTRYKGEYAAIVKRQKDNSIHELMLLGLDQNVEDTTSDTERSTNKIVKTIDEKILSRTNQFVRSGLDILFITRRTKFYKVANEFLEVSDLIARDVQNRIEKSVENKQADGKRMLPDWWLESKGIGYSSKQRLVNDERKEFLIQAEKVRHHDLLDDYIIYPKPSGKFEEYLNKVGVLMFTKYTKRIQRVIAKTTSKGAIKATLTAILAGSLLDVPNILEQSFLVKNWYTESIGAGNVFPVYNLIDSTMNAIVPSLIKSSTYDFSL